MKSETKALFEQKQHDLLIDIRKYLKKEKINLDKLFFLLGQSEWSSSCTGFCEKSGKFLGFEEAGIDDEKVEELFDLITEYQDEFVELFENAEESCPEQICIVFDLNTDEIHRKYVNKASAEYPNEIVDNWEKKVSADTDDLLPEILSSDSGIFLQGVEIEYDSNIKSSAKHIKKDLEVIEKVEINHLMKEHLLPWLLNEQFAEKDPENVLEGLRISNIQYHYSKIAEKASPTGKAAFFGTFIFQIESSSEYTAEILEAVEMNILVRNGEIADIRNFDV